MLGSFGIVKLVGVVNCERVNINEIQVEVPSPKVALKVIVLTQ